MAQQPSQSFFQEAADAAQGAWALIFGRSDSARYFDFSPRGVIGSFIALVLAVAISVFGPQLLGVAPASGSASSLAMLSLLIFALQIGAAYIVLQVMGRLDGFMPYLVADNWVNLFSAVVGAVTIVLFRGSDLVLLVVGILAIILEINIARRIVTLAPMQVAIFIAGQIIAQVVGLLLLGSVLLPPLTQAG